MGAHVEGDDGDVIIRAHGTEEAVGGVAHVVDEVVAVGGELEQHDGGDGGLGEADAGDVLGDAVFEDLEVFGLEAGDELVGLVEDDVDVEVDDGDVDAQGVGLVVGFLTLGSAGATGTGGWSASFFFLRTMVPLSVWGPPRWSRRGVGWWAFAGVSGGSAGGVWAWRVGMARIRVRRARSA